MTAKNTGAITGCCVAVGVVIALQFKSGEGSWSRQSNSEKGNIEALYCRKCRVDYGEVVALRLTAPGMLNPPSGAHWKIIAKGKGIRNEFMRFRGMSEDERGDGFYYISRDLEGENIILVYRDDKRTHEEKVELNVDVVSLSPLIPVPKFRAK
jgi:hypothetical protein